MKKVSANEAMLALEALDDCARMDVGVNSYGAYNILRRFILQNSEVEESGKAAPMETEV